MKGKFRFFAIAVAAFLLSACAAAQTTLNRIPHNSNAIKAVRVVKVTVYEKFGFDKSSSVCNMWSNCPFLFSNPLEIDKEVQETINYFVNSFSDELKSADIAVFPNAESSNGDEEIVNFEVDFAYRPGFYAVIIAQPAIFVSRARGYVGGNLVLEVHMGESKGIWSKKKVVSDVARKLGRAVIKEIKAAAP